MLKKKMKMCISTAEMLFSFFLSVGGWCVVVSIMWYIFMTICCHFRYLYASDRTTGSFKYFGMCRPKLGSFVCSHIGFKISILLRNYS